MSQAKSSMTCVIMLSALLSLSACGSASQTANNNNSSSSASNSSNTTNAQSRGATNGKPQDDVLSGPEDDVLIDYRSELNYDEPKLQPQEKQRILKAVYGAGFQKGNPVINSARDGSFTAPEVKETVYLIQKGGPMAVDPESLKGTTLAVFDGEHLVARFDTSEFNFILRLSDLNQDGVDELLLQGSAYNMGTLVSWARLVDVKDRQLHLIKDFDAVEKESCGGVDSASEILAAIVRTTSTAQGKWPEFSVKYYRAPCPAESGKPDPQSFRAAPDAKIER